MRRFVREAWRALRFLLCTKCLNTGHLCDECRDYAGTEEP